MTTAIDTAHRNQCKIVALLPIKAHSSRVPGKNFRLLAGKPLFQWILDTLLSIDEIGQIVINTDARESLSKHGVSSGNRILIRDRSAEICGDNVSMNLVLEEDIRNVPADVYLMTHCTNPFLGSKTISSALKRFQHLLREGKADSLFSVNKVQGRFYRRDASPVNHDPTNLIPTQELEPWYEENSNLYLFTGRSFAQTQARIGSKPSMYETSATESIDIDTLDDWRLAEMVAYAIVLNKETA